MHPSLTDKYSTEKKGFIARCSEIFKLPSEKTMDFAAGIKALTEKDRADLHRWFNEAGLPTDEPTKVAQAA